MEYDHNIENVFLSIVNDQKAYKNAVSVIKHQKAGGYAKYPYNRNLPLHKHIPPYSVLAVIAEKASVYSDFRRLNKDQAVEAWRKIVDYIDPEFLHGQDLTKNPCSEIEFKTDVAPDHVVEAQSSIYIKGIGLDDSLLKEAEQHMNNAAGIFRNLADKLDNCNNQTKQRKEPMPLVKNVTYFKGADIKAMSEDELIKAIKTMETEIDDLKAVKTQSKKINTNIADIEAAIVVVVAELDSRS